MKTPRPLAWMRRAAGIATMGLALLAMAGCDPRMLLYFLQPFEPTINAPGPALKGKKVVIYTNAGADARAVAEAIDQEIGRRLAKILRENVRRIELVDAKEVEAWKKEHPTATDPAEAGEFFGADIVIFLEVQAFQIEDPKSVDMFEGRSSVAVRVTELKTARDSKGKELIGQPKEREIIFEELRDSAFPVRGPAMKSETVTRPLFKRKFLDLVAAEISWLFVPHAPGDNIQDVNFDK